mgnify:CR=1 FL=1
MSGYGQFCPVAKAMELLDERWTHARRAGTAAGQQALQRPAPRRAEDVARAAVQAAEVADPCRCVVERAEIDGAHHIFADTECGKELADVVEALGAWGVRWIGELGEEDLDPHLLMWDMRRTIPVEAWPRSRTTLAFHLDGVAPKASRWWLVVADGEADVCDFDPGFEVAGTGRDQPAHADPHLARRRRLVSMRCSTAASRCRARPMSRRAIPSWIGQGSSAAVPRPA